jgi:hypothetical protein
MTCSDSSTSTLTEGEIDSTAMIAIISLCFVVFNCPIYLVEATTRVQANLHIPRLIQKCWLMKTGGAQGDM